MKSISSLIVTIVGCLALMMTACGRPNEPAALQIPTVNLDTLRSTGSNATLQYPGRVKASDEVNLSFKVSGRIDRILVKEGDHVKRGQLVALLDPSDYEAQLRATEAEHARITAESERVIGLYNDSAISANDYDKAVFGKQQIDAKLKNHQDQLTYTRLYAPMDGFIHSKMMSTGEIVSAGMPVLSLLGSGSTEVEISLSAAAYSQRESFSGYTCSFDIYPDKVFKLVPVSVSPKANANQLYTMRFALQDDGKEMPTPGMNTMVTISMEQNDFKSELTMPTSGVLHANGRTSVFVFDTASRTLHEYTVSLVRLLNDGRCVVMSDNLHKGDLVVVSGIHHVRDGQQVKPLEPASDTNVGGLL